MKGDTRILELFLLFRMSKEEIIGLINEKQPVVFVSGEHAYMVRDYRCDMTEQTPRMLGGSWIGILKDLMKNALRSEKLKLYSKRFLFLEKIEM